MSFLVYRTSTRAGRTEFSRLKGVSLAGHRKGLICRTLVRRSEFAEKWHVTEADMLQTARCDPGHHALILDMRPSVENEASMYRIRDVWGYSDEYWTRLLLRFDFVFWHEGDDYAAQKERFVLLDGGAAYEFLYLRGGIKDGICRGTWNFPMGTITGTLLSEDSLEYFMPILERQRQGSRTVKEKGDR